MKIFFKLLFAVIFLLATCATTFSQKGYLGKRVHILLDTRLSPARSNPDFNGDMGYFKFNYDLKPSVEWVANSSLVVGANYQFFKTTFDNFLGSSNQMQEYEKPGKINVSGFGIYTKLYTNKTAPLGYYYKLEVDKLNYNIDVMYRKYDSSVKVKPPFAPHTEKGSMFGFRFEFGRTFMLTDYVSMGTGISIGATSKGLSDDNTNLLSLAEKRLFFNAMFGLHLSFGIMAF